MTNFDKQTIIFAYAQLQNSVTRVLNIKNVTLLRHEKKQIDGNPANRLLDVCETLCQF